MEKKAIELLLSSLLSPLGFRKKGSSWYRQQAEVLQMIDLQRSSFGNQYYVNLCFVPIGMQIEGMPTPREYKCPLRIRTTAVFPDRANLLTSLFDFERAEITDIQREVGIRAEFNDRIVPFVLSLDSRKALSQAIAEGRFKGGLVSGTLEDFLETGG